MIPTNLGSLLAPLEPQLPGQLANGVQCEGAKFHSPTPLLVRRCNLYQLALHAMLGVQSITPPTELNVVLCATCESNIRVALVLFADQGGNLPWAVRREFGNMVRALAERAWAYWVEHPVEVPDLAPKG